MPGAKMKTAEAKAVVDELYRKVTAVALHGVILQAALNAAEEKL